MYVAPLTENTHLNVPVLIVFAVRTARLSEMLSLTPEQQCLLIINLSVFAQDENIMQSMQLFDNVI